MDRGRKYRPAVSESGNMTYVSIFLFLSIQRKNKIQITTDTKDPVVVASPIGKSVSANRFDARYASGILAHKIAIRLWTKEIQDAPQAQKYPLKQK